MEETVGRVWHDFITGAAGGRYPEAAVTLKEIEKTAGILFRAFADGTIGLAPALSCTADEMGDLLRRLEKTLNDVLDQSDIRMAIA